MILVFEIGQSAIDDNLDRGIKFKYKTDAAKVGFFGMDDSDQKFTYIPDATDSGKCIFWYNWYNKIKYRR